MYLCMFNTSSVECCVCKELVSKDFKRCKQCKNAIVCTSCLLGMAENGLCDKCPLCRQIDWLSKNVKSVKVQPLETKNNITMVETSNTELVNRCSCRYSCDCKKIYTIFMLSMIYLILSYSYGFLTLLICLNGKIEKNVTLFIWLPTPIGFIELFLSTYLCFRFVCKVRFNTFSEYFSMIRPNNF